MVSVLDDNYDIVNNLSSFDTDDEFDGYELVDGKFANFEGPWIVKKILQNDTNDGDYPVFRQIFKMIDGNFVLEIEKDEEYTHYISNDIGELLYYQP